MSTDTDALCWDCVGDAVLREWVRDRGHVGGCSFCGKRRRVCELNVVADEIDRVIRQFYAPASDTPHVVDWSDNIKYWADGESAEEIITEIAEVEPAVAEAVVELLAESEWRDVADGADAYYGESPLQHIRAYPNEFMEIWEAFDERLKHEVRFFDLDGKQMLDRLFGDLPSIGGGGAILTITPGDPSSTLFRARLVDEESKAEEFIRDPAQHIGPPLPHRARAGRMNPAGIPAFYGAFSKEVALAELRPPVGGMVAVGKFSLLRPVRLLDMSFFPFAYHQESIFSPAYDTLRNKVTFLARFHHRISRPVLPTDETLAYLPTQAVAAYVTNVMGLDGIVYSSTQIGGETTETADRLAHCNIALFASAAVVEPTEPPPRPPEITNFDEPPISLDYLLEPSPGPAIPSAPKIVRSNPPDSSPSADAAELEVPTEPRQTSSPVMMGSTLWHAPIGDLFGPPIDARPKVNPTLRVARDPELVRITAVKVEASAIFAHLYEDGRVIVNERDLDEDED